ncbi:MAG: alkaline phosphatase [Bacillota bacterium]
MRKGVYQKPSAVMKTMLCSALCVFVLAAPQAPAYAKAADKSKVKNVIVMISDGCGYNQIKATDYYQYGKTGKQVYEKFPVKAAMSTYSVGSYDPALAWESFDYVRTGATDSAAAATAMSTGEKTYDAAIGVDLNGQPLKHVAEKFEKQGKATGIVTSVQLSHATPAGFVAHNASRNNYSEIANEMIKSSATDVIMGAGNPWYNDNGVKKASTTTSDYKYVGGKTTWIGLTEGTLPVADADGDGKSDPWTLIQTKAQFQKMATGKTPKRVIGVAQAYTTLQQARSGDTNADPYDVPLNKNVPTLSDMSKAALNVLGNDKDGFFLMIEGGAIDWASHANQTGRLLEEEIDFNKAVQAVCNWVEKNSNWNETLLIITGDHETGYLTGPGSNPEWEPVVNNGKGNVPGVQWNSGDHTNSLVPLFAKGAQANKLLNYADMIDPVRGAYLDNTEIAKMISKAIG